MSMLDKMNQRIADNAFQKFAAGDCLIESDGQGPELWNTARKAAVTGLAALTLFTAVAPAYAHDIQMPTEQMSSVYLEQTEKALADKGLDFLGNGVTGIKAVDRPGVGEYEAAPELNTATLIEGIEVPVPFSGSSCVISYAIAPSTGYESSLNLPEGFDIGRYEEMRAISYCATLGLLAGRSFRQHAGTDSGAIPLADVMTSLATAKYDTAAFEGVYEMQSALALSALRSGDANEQAVALWKLEALGKAHDYVHSEEGSRSISNASIQNLVDISDMLVRVSQHSLKESGLIPAQLSSAPLNDLQAVLADAGMKDAARTAAHVAESGLSKEGGYFSAVRSKGCDDIERISIRREMRLKAICKFFEEHKWAADGDDAFVADFEDFANSMINSQTLPDQVRKM